MSTFNTKYVDDLILQIENTTQCDAIELIIDTHISLLTDLIKAQIDIQLDIALKYLPVLNLPSANPGSILSWIKKFVGGAVMPQLEAYITIALQIIEAINSLSRLASALALLPGRLQACITDSLTVSLTTNITDLVNGYTSQLTDALSSINTIQSQLSTILGAPLAAVIDTTSITSFTADPLQKLTAIQSQVNAFVNQPLPIVQSFSGAVQITDDVRFVIEDGQIINVIN